MLDFSISLFCSMPFLCFCTQSVHSKTLFNVPQTIQNSGSFGSRDKSDQSNSRNLVVQVDICGHWKNINDFVYTLGAQNKYYKKIENTKQLGKKLTKAMRTFQPLNQALGISLTPLVRQTFTEKKHTNLFAQHLWNLSRNWKNESVYMHVY